MHVRIVNGCEMRIDNSVTRVTVRHHGACRVMPNSKSYLSDGIFNLHRKTIMDSFSCVLFLRQLHLDLNMFVCFFFFFFYAKITTVFDQETFGIAPLLYVDFKRLAETDVKMTSNRQTRHTDVMHESRLTPLM